jgi:hypothetical protein
LVEYFTFLAFNGQSVPSDAYAIFLGVNSQLIIYHSTRYCVPTDENKEEFYKQLLKHPNLSNKPKAA